VEIKGKGGRFDGEGGNFRKGVAILISMGKKKGGSIIPGASGRPNGEGKKSWRGTKLFNRERGKAAQFQRNFKGEKGKAERTRRAKFDT